MRQEHEQHRQAPSGAPRQKPVWAWALSSMGARVLGLLTVSVLLAAEDAHSETYAETVGAVTLALIMYWLTHSYAQFASWRIEHSERLTLRGLAREMRHEFPFLNGAALPLVPILICWAADVGLNLAIKLALYTDAALIIAVEVIAGLRADLTRRELLGQTLLGAALGLLVLVLRLVLHH
jgi:hypothetical protein